MTTTQTTEISGPGRHDFQALIASDEQAELRVAMKILRDRYRDLCLEPMDEPQQGMDQRWSVVLRPTVDLF